MHTFKSTPLQHNCCANVCCVGECVARACVCVCVLRARVCGRQVCTRVQAAQKVPYSFLHDADGATRLAVVRANVPVFGRHIGHFLAACVLRALVPPAQRVADQHALAWCAGASFGDKALGRCPGKVGHVQRARAGTFARRRTPRA